MVQIKWFKHPNETNATRHDKSKPIKTFAEKWSADPRVKNLLLTFSRNFIMSLDDVMLSNGRWKKRRMATATYTMM
jgi:hypothetical protein